MLKRNVLFILLILSISSCSIFSDDILEEEFSKDNYSLLGFVEIDQKLISLYGTENKRESLLIAIHDEKMNLVYGKVATGYDSPVAYDFSDNYFCIHILEDKKPYKRIFIYNASSDKIMEIQGPSNIFDLTIINNYLYVFQGWGIYSRINLITGDTLDFENNSVGFSMLIDNIKYPDQEHRYPINNFEDLMVFNKDFNKNITDEEFLEMRDYLQTNNEIYYNDESRIKSLLEKYDIDYQPELGAPFHRY